MTAGSGIQHSEMFPMVNSEAPNTLEIFQIWLNLPKRSKRVDPHFKMLWKDVIPVIEIADDQDRATQIDLIAGTFNGRPAPEPTPDSWAADPEHAVGVYTVRMEPRAEFTLPATKAEAGRTIFFYRGDKIEIDDTDIPYDHRIAAAAGEDLRIRNGNEEAFLLILEGVPINEPVVQHGPFVMNTQDEIRETMREYGKTQFGGWPWPETEVAHPKDSGRFALHADGTREIK